MDEKVNFLILDEPTNHLDIASREWVEAAIEEYEGALLFVSHDRYFVSRFAERIWELQDGKITDYPFGYEKYRAVKEREAAARQTTPAEKKKEKKEKPAHTGGTKNTEKLVRRLEREIDTCEKEIAALDAEIEAAASDYQKLSGLMEQRAAADEHLTELMEQWEAASLELEG